MSYNFCRKCGNYGIEFKDSTFKCTQCGKKFSEIYHLRKGEGVCACCHCGLVFLDEEFCEKHIQDSHKSKVSDSIIEDLKNIVEE